jgi:hypothetical protein
VDAGALEAAPSLGGEFVDDVESADVEGDASFDVPEPLSADFASAFEPVSFDSEPDPERA